MISLSYFTWAYHSKQCTKQFMEEKFFVYWIATMTMKSDDCVANTKNPRNQQIDIAAVQPNEKKKSTRWTNAWNWTGTHLGSFAYTQHMHLHLFAFCYFISSHMCVCVLCIDLLCEYDFCLFAAFVAASKINWLNYQTLLKLLCPNNKTHWDKSHKYAENWKRERAAFV